MSRQKKLLSRKSLGYVLAQKESMFENFTCTITNKTARIETEQEKIIFADKSFPTRVFPVYQKLKKEVKESGIIAPRVEPYEVNYYEFSKRLPAFMGRAFGYDINQAYLQALYNEGYVSSEMFETINKMPKKYRLQVIGMLASSKEVLFFEKGHLVEKTSIVDQELRNVFFHCAQIVGLCLREVMEIEKNNFLFYWVDGVVTRKPIGLDVFQDFGFEIKTEEIKDWRSKPIRNGKKIVFLKDGKRKNFRIKC